MPAKKPKENEASRVCGKEHEQRETKGAKRPVNKRAEERKHKPRAAPSPSVRRQVEARIDPQAADVSEMGPDEIRALVHELQVRQVELETQNEELRVAQRELGEARNRYLDLYEFAPVGYLTLDERRIIRDANLSATKLLNAERRRLIGGRLESCVLPEDRDACYVHLCEAAEQGTRSCEVRIARTDGEVAYARLETSRIGATPEAFEGWRVTLHDVTERRRAEDARRESESRYRLLFDRNPDGVFAVDPSGRFILANPACEAISGYSSVELLKKRFIDLCAPDQVADTLASFERSLRERTYAQLETALIRKDGQRVEMWVAGEPILSDDRVVAVHCTAKDIAERKRAEEALRKSDETVRRQLAESETVYRSAHVGLCVFDEHLRYVRINDRMAEFNGIPASEHIGKTPRQIVLGLAEKAEALHRQILETGEPVLNMEFSGTTPAQPGVLRTWIEHWHPLQDSAGKVIGINVVAQEITERKRAEEALRELKDDLEVRVQRRTTELAQASRALAAERQRFHDVLDMLPAYVVLLAPDYHVPFANRFFEERFGKSEGRRCYEYLFNRTEPCEVCETYKVLETGAPLRWEWVGPDGCSYDIHDFPFSDADGSAMIMEVGLDVTGVKQAEAALKGLNETLERRVADRTAELRESEVRLKRAQEIAHLGSWELDLSSGALTWSDEVYRIFGLQPRAFGATYKAFLERVHPDDRAAVDAAYSGSVHEGRDSYELEHRVVRKDTGEVRWVQERCQHVRDADGRLIRSLGMVLDITERREAEAALRKSEERHRSLFSNMSEGFALHEVITDAAGRPCDYRFLEVNPSFGRLTGLEGPDLIGRRVLEVLPGTEAYWIESFGKVALTGEPAHLENYSADLNRWYEVFAYRPAARQFAVIFTDITERKRAEESIRAALSEKEVLLKEIHHRVKNNMQVISSLVALQADELPDAAMRDILQDVTHRVRSMAMVHEKLYQSADLARVEFAGYTQSLLNYLWRAHGTAASGVRLEQDLEPVRLSVTTAVPCGLILNELVSNALKHAFSGRDGGEVRVSLRGDGEGEVCLRVRDNGRGLPPGMDWRRSRSLGLRLVQMLTGQLRGAVQVMTREGEGTEFQVVFGQRGR